MIQTTEQKLAVEAAETIMGRIDQLYAEVDDILTPYTKELSAAIQNCTDSAVQAELIRLVNELPFGFYRSELRVILIQKFGTNR